METSFMQKNQKDKIPTTSTINQELNNHKLENRVSPWRSHQIFDPTQRKATKNNELNGTRGLNKN